MANTGFIVWFTGLSGAGKSTLAQRLRVELNALGRYVEVLDGDEVRSHLSDGLGFTKEDRDTNIRRVGYVARLVARSGSVAIVAAISPYREARDQVRSQAPAFFEVYVRCSLEALVRRDVKGLYAKAMRGEIKNFTGVDDPYEPPLAPEIVVDTEQESVEESLANILDGLERAGHVWLGVRERILPHGQQSRAFGLPRLDVDARTAADALMLGSGALSPLEGFMDEADYLSVLADGRLRSGRPFTIPVNLPVDREAATSAARAGSIAIWHAGHPIAVMAVASVFELSAAEATSVYGTDDPKHPGVRLLRERPSMAVGGPVQTLRQPQTGFARYDLSPLEVRRIRAERGWRSMVGFQTRNPVHRAHEYIQKVALESIDGLLLHPLVGDTKADDIPAATRMASYEVLLDRYFPSNRTLLATNPAWMRYAGPREAVFHALIRRNYGCTHFIVGRDHAGIGNYYDTYAAQRIFDQYDPSELGIEILRFEHTFWCADCAGMASSRTCPHPGERHMNLSGTELRQLLAEGRSVPVELTRPEVARELQRPIAAKA